MRFDQEPRNEVESPACPCRGCCCSKDRGAQVSSRTPSHMPRPTRPWHAPLEGGPDPTWHGSDGGPASWQESQVCHLFGEASSWRWLSTSLPFSGSPHGIILRPVCVCTAQWNAKPSVPAPKPHLVILSFTPPHPGGLHETHLRTAPLPHATLQTSHRRPDLQGVATPCAGLPETQRASSSPSSQARTSESQTEAAPVLVWLALSALGLPTGGRGEWGGRPALSPCRLRGWDTGAQPPLTSPLRAEGPSGSEAYC